MKLDQQVHRPRVGDIPQANGYPRCPVCSSWDVQRHVEMGRVWFTCRRCGAVFGNR
jgi:hypothetical protein